MERVLGADVPVVVVEAGAGYGKSTVLGQVVDAEVRAVGWLTADASDDDPMVLVRHLVDALGDAGQDVDEVRSVLGGPEPDLEGRVLPLLGAVVEQSGTPFLVVVDDVHVITSPRADGAGVPDPGSCPAGVHRRAVGSQHAPLRPHAARPTRGRR